MSASPKTDFREILRVLRNHGVDFIVVGGVAAVLQGAPMTTFDLDIVHSTAPENIPRLLDALTELDAFYRIQPERRLRPQSTHVASSGHQLLLTVHGPLDLLGSAGRGRTYTDLLPHTRLLDLGEGRLVRILSLEMLIALKEETGRDRDMAILPLLKKTLEISKRQR